MTDKIKIDPVEYLPDGSGNLSATPDHGGDLTAPVDYLPELHPPLPPEPRNWLQQATDPITGIPREVGGFAAEGLNRIYGGAQDMYRGFYPSQRPEVGPFPINPGLQGLRGMGNIGLGALETLTSPYLGTMRSIASRPIENVTGIPKEYTEFAGSFAVPMMPKRIPSFSRPPAPITREGGLTLTQGEASGDLATIQREQAALRGVSGGAPQRAAQEFTQQRAAELPAERQRIMGGMSPTGEVVAQSPQEAAAIAQNRILAEQQAAQQNVAQQFTEARRRAGEATVDADVFRSMPQTIARDLRNAEEPVLIGEGLTKHADQAIAYLEAQAKRLAATPNVSGLNMQAIDTMRRNLSARRKAAFESGDMAEARAAGAVLDQFDNTVERAIAGGQFSGSPEAVQAWARARAAHADFRSTFGTPYGGSPRDPVGNIVQQIVRTGDNPATVREVINHLYGSSGVNPSSLNVAVTTRVRNILKEDSPEWAAVKQGLFSKLTESGPNIAEFAPKRVSDSINNFFNQSPEMASVLYSPAERAMMRQYADTMRRMVIPQAGANWSNTATFAGQAFVPSRTQRALNLIGSELGALVTGALGGVPAWLATEAGIGAATGAGMAVAARVGKLGTEAKEAAQIARQMPVLRRSMEQYSRAGTAFEMSPSAYNRMRLTQVSSVLANNLRTANLPIPDALREMLQ